MYKGCSYCGRVHDSKYKCIEYKQTRSRYVHHDGTDKLRNRYAWAKKSKEVREASHYLCEVCKDQGVYTYDNLEVHHITKLRDNPEGLLQDNNLICLCQYHHELADRGDIDIDYLQKLANSRLT